MSEPILLESVSELIGNTPSLQLRLRNSGWRLLIKLEKVNPGGSMKDRMARHMVMDAERRGLLRPGGTIVESSSGNTGIGLAMIAAERGYRFIAIVDHHASKDKIRIMRALGADIITVGQGKAADEVATADRDRMAEKVARELPGAHWTRQHDNPANAQAYSDTLAGELLRATEGRLDVLVGAVGTGGSLCGTARFLKQQLPRLHVAGVEPAGSIIFGGPGMPYYQSGTGTPEGADVGEVMDYSLIDEGLKVTDAQAFNTSRFLARRYALLLGGSSGGVIYKAIELLSRRSGSGTMVAIAGDGGEKYLDTVFDDGWMKSVNLLDLSVEAFLDEALAPRSGRAQAAPAAAT
ncbi:cystathionine beta-synthase [Stigmatella aurantiaca]|uniref:Cystathionine beta-synthase n=1 Tax=Stigmatella aurantiaca TaxID=41 RepID=A0A1H7RXJ2_STIAU|nr:cysteine synthase family protein [Stigmatella aurantiaca]SEL64107.1 cystathionine beta-synthase [Stigmatella aurantiaca]